jgi:hypothetical protein
MFDWIDAFLNDRTFQVRVGTKLSQIHTLENGTAQGANFSPLAFISMIDDLTDSLENVESSLFADDSMIYKGGRSLPVLIKSVQNALDAIADWSDTWGFKVSTSKTVAVLFTPGAKEHPVELKFKESALKIEKSARFLGVVFDSKLTWKQHAEYVTQKCQKRINLMRAVSGTRWGAEEKSLLTIYRALMRSVVDYGSIVLDSASAAISSKIQSIQTEALRICCGAMRSTAAAALQVECNEPPLHLRRLAQQIKFAVKIHSSDSNPAKAVFAEHWTSVYGKYTERRRPLAAKVSEYFAERCVRDNAAGPIWARIPPWAVSARLSISS